MFICIYIYIYIYKWLRLKAFWLERPPSPLYQQREGVGETSTLPQTLVHFHHRPGILSAFAPLHRRAGLLHPLDHARSSLQALLRLLRRG